MASYGLNLGRIAYLEDSASSRPLDRRHRAAPSTPRAGVDGQSQPRVGPMFELSAGNLQRPFRERSGVGSTLVSSLAHGAFFATLFVFVSLSGQLALPDPNQTSSLMAILVAAPPPPPPPAAAEPASPAPAASAPAPEEPVLKELAPAPPQLDFDLDLPLAPPEEPPVLALAAAPGLSNGLGGGFGSGPGAGFGVEGGVGWGTGASGPGVPVRVGKEISAPEVIHRVEPVYPPDAVTARVEGTVVVEATVDEQGNVIAVNVLRSIGPLDQAAIDAVTQWRYSPLRVNDEPAQFVLTVNVSFRLH